MKTLRLTIAAFAGLFGTSTLLAAWTATETANEYTDGYWTITLSGQTLSKVVPGGEVAADLDLTSFADDTGIAVTRVGVSACITNLIASFIGPDVVHLGASAFRMNTGVTNIVLSSEWDQALTGADQILYNCSNLENLSPKVIKWTGWSGGYLITGCPKLNIDVEFPLLDKVCYHRTTFSGAGFTSISMPLFPGEASSSYGEMLKDCKSLARIYMPKAEYVRDLFAYSCTNLVEVYMPCCTNLGYANTFANCSRLERVTIGQTLSRLPNSAFQNCSKLASFEPFLPEGINDSGYFSAYSGYCGQGFSGCSSLAQPLVMKSDTLQKLERQIFYNCAQLSDITLDLPALTNIDISVFHNIAAGAEIKWLSPNAPESIEANAFWPRSSADPVKIFLRRLQAADAWRVHCTRLRRPVGDETALTDADLALASYPGNKTIGIIDANGNKAWVVRDYTAGTVIMVR